jgi:hypothetical protein
MSDVFDAYYWTIRTGDSGWARYGGRIYRQVTKTLKKDPKWQEKVAALLDATQSYSRIDTVSNLDQPFVNWRWVGKSGGALVTTRLKGDPITQTLGAYLTMASPDTDRVRSDVKLGFLSKIRDEESPFQALPFFAELKETIDMVKHPLKGILAHTKGYRNRVTRILGAPKKADRVSQALEKAYLQWTYGVSPLIGDIESIKDAILKMYEVEEVKRISVSGSDELPLQLRLNGTRYIENGWGFMSTHVLSSACVKVRISGALRNKLAGPSIEKAQQVASVRLRDFVPSVYEWLPYSFLVDYISTTGDVLGGLFTNTSNLVYASESIKETKTVIGMCIPLPGITGSPISFPISAAVGKRESVTFNRSKANLSVGLRDLHWRHPSAGQWFNTAVLGIQAFRG